MAKKQILISLFIFSVFLTFYPAGFADFNDSEIVQIGSAKVEITPNIGTPLSGYGRRHGKPSKGVHDPLYARVISLQKGEKHFVFVSLDLVLVDQNLRNEILQDVRREMPIEESELVLTATHTHSGSGAIGKRFWEKMIGGKFNKKIFEEMSRLIAGAIVQANKKKAEVKVEWGQISANEFIENRMDDKSDIPLFLKVIRFRSGLKTLGQFIFFPAHPTLYSAKNRHFSADYPGVLTSFLEKENPDSVALFVNGAAGDLRPRTIDSDYPEKRVETYGKSIFELSQKIKYEPLSMDGDWISKFKIVKLPSVKARYGFIHVPSLLGNRFFPKKTIFQTIELGKAMIVALPGEASSEVGAEIERRVQGKGFVPFVAGYANDFVGYVIPERYYRDQSQYESETSFYGSHFDTFVHQSVDGLLPQSPEFGGILLKDAAMPILYLKGNAYQIGYQHGHLMSKEIKEAKTRIYRYMSHKLIVPGVSRVIVKTMLMRAWNKMEPFISCDELMEMKGLADGSGLSLSDVERLHAIPDLIESMCTNGVYFGSATKDGRLIHIRNLDWLRQMGVHKQATIMIYEPEDGIPYMSLGYYGFIGVLTGMNEDGISVGQVGADSIDESLYGTPMPFLIKRALSRSHTLEDVEKIITKSNRTSSFNYMIGDAKNKKAIAIETTQHHFRVFKDDDPLEAKSGYGFPIKNVIMRADPAFDPDIRNLQTCSRGNPNKEGIEPPAGSAYETRYVKQSKLVKENYGHITPEIAIQILKSIAPDSNIQSAVLEFPDFWIANATDELPAAKTEYHHFNYENLRTELKMRAEEMKRSELKVGKH